MDAATHRLSEGTDLDAVFAIYMHASVNPYLGYDPMPREQFAPIFAMLVADGTFHVWQQDSTILGFYRLQRRVGRASHVAYLGTVAVAPHAQGRGVATQMLRATINRCRVDGIRRIELMVEPDNPRAIALYERLGFVHEGTMRLAYKRSADATAMDELFYALLL
jgi:RimJ/RimL family protein N-acetyltransferase